MSQRKKASAGFWAGVSLGSLLAAPLLYLLLLGPVQFLWESGNMSDDARVDVFYLVNLSYNSIGGRPESFWKNYAEYLELWGNLAGSDRMSL